MPDEAVPHFEGYLFDLDGTLIDTAPDLGLALNEALNRNGFPVIPDEIVRDCVGRGARTMLKQALAQVQRNPADEKFEEMLSLFLDSYKKNLVIKSTPYDGVSETLKILLNSGVFLAVVTNKLTEFTLPILKKLDLLRYFQTVICGDTASEPKPSAAPLLMALKDHKIEKNKILMVGDSETDILAAKNAGIRSAFFKYGYNGGKREDELQPDYVISRLDSLVKTKA